MLELYHSGLTTCSKQVRLCLAEKEIDYVSRYIELWTHENLKPGYLKLNPNGVVPTLVHDGHAIVNSFAINEYLEDSFPERPLRPADPRGRARMRLWMWTADEVHRSVQTTTYNAFLRPRMRKLRGEQIETMLAHMPDPDRRERARRVSTTGIDEREIENAFAKIAFVLTQVEEALADGPWMAGAMYTLADISMIAIVHRVVELRPELVDRGTFPRVNDWRDRMTARPAVIKVYSSPSDEAPPRPERMSLSGLE